MFTSTLTFAEALGQKSRKVCSCSARTSSDRSLSFCLWSGKGKLASGAQALCRLSKRWQTSTLAKCWKTNKPSPNLKIDAHTHTWSDPSISVALFHPLGSGKNHTDSFHCGDYNQPQNTGPLSNKIQLVPKLLNRPKAARSIPLFEDKAQHNNHSLGTLQLFWTSRAVVKQLSGTVTSQLGSPIPHGVLSVVCCFQKHISW